VTGHPFELAAYLKRVRCELPREPGLEALAELQQAHLAEIPFENLDILLGRSIHLDLESLAAKLVAGGRGGYCFEQNTLFRAALEALGFRVASLAARVRSSSARPAAPAVPEVRPRTHMLLLVELPEGRFVADVGFGGDAPVRPVPLEDGAETELAGFRHRLRREGDEWWRTTSRAPGRPLLS
jgi:N-hydroxyarylamine O-acetyltransferase